jgi:acetyl-CoA carboxylase biotin carboxyl carrier protein
VTGEWPLDETELRKLVRLFVTSNVQQLSLDVGSLHVDIDKRPGTASFQSRPALDLAIAGAGGAAAGAGTAGVADVALVDVRSPGLGIVRWPPDGGRDTPLDVGDQVEEDEELCSLDVLGRLTPIVAPVGGTVAEISVEDGAFVEYGQVLLRLRPGHP